MKKYFFVLAAVIFGSRIKAQFVQADSMMASMDEVVLTANKYPKKQSETGKVITVINRQQLERSAGKTLGELLTTIAGTTIIGANNNPGTNLTSSIRGAAAGNVLILLDGIPVNDPSVISNYFDLNFLSIDQVERIEILKGGQSTLYGSDAVAGVINIISKKAVTKKINFTGNLCGGSYNTFKQSAGIAGRTKNVDYSLNYTHLSSTGFSAAYDKNNTGNFDKDGFQQHVASGRFGFRAGKRISIVLSGMYSNYKTDLDASAFTDEKDFTGKNNNKQVGAGIVYTFNKGALHLNYSYNRAERNYLDDSLFKSSPFVTYSQNNFIGRTYYAELYGNWKLNRWELLLGGDYRLNNTDQYSLYIFPGFPVPASSLNAKMNQASPYASLVYTYNGFTIEGGGRFNFHSEYGTNATFTLNPSYLIKNKAKIFGNLYSAFKTPTLFQLFDPSAGNVELSPEKGITGEAGAELFSAKSFKTRLVGFYRNTKDAIVYTYDPSTFTGKYLNASKQINYGIELETAYHAGKLNITANYTYTDGKTISRYNGTGNRLSKDTSYYNLYRIPKHALNVNAGVQLTKVFFTSIQIHAVSKRDEFIYGNTPELLKAYTTIDLYSEYNFGATTKLFLDLKNITNKQYFDFLGYNARKFNFAAGISFKL
ncbi:MAG: TonB-dependent receptor [Bacteroidota bacterium]